MSEFNDDLRPADNQFADTLLPYNGTPLDNPNTEYERLLAEAINASLMDLQEQEKQADEYQNVIIQSYQNETIERKKRFQQLLIDIERVSKFDKDLKELYEILEPILESYFSQFIEFCVLDEQSYDRIFKTLKNVRTNLSWVEDLKNIIHKEA